MAAVRHRFPAMALGLASFAVITPFTAPAVRAHAQAPEAPGASIYLPVALDYREATLQPVGQAGGRSLALACAGPYIYLGVGMRVLMVDVSDPDQPTAVGETAAFPDVVTDVDEAGGRLYVLANAWHREVTDRLHVFDLKDPRVPRPIVDWPVPGGTATALTVHGGRGYLTGAAEGFLIVELGDRTGVPRLIGQSRAESVSSLVTNGSMAFALSFARDPTTYDTLVAPHLFDVSEPSDVRELPVPPDILAVGQGRWQCPGGASPADDEPAMAFVDGLLYVGSYDLGAFDLDTPSEPGLVACVRGAGGNAMVVVGERAYVAGAPPEGRTTSVAVLDVARSRAPRRLDAAIDADRYGVQLGDGAIAAGIDAIYTVGSGYLPSLRVTDVRDPAHPRPAGSLDVLWAPGDIDVTGSLAAVADDTNRGLRLVDVRDPREAHVTATITGGHVRGLALTTDVLYASVWPSALAVYDIRAPGGPRWVGAVTWPEEGSRAVDAAIAGDSLFAFVDAGMPGGGFGGFLSVVDVADPTAPVEVARTGPIAGWGVHLVGDGARIFVTANNDRLTSRVTVIDVSDPRRPVAAAALDLASDANDLALRGAQLFIASGEGFEGLTVVDVRHSEAPRVVGRLRLGESTAIAVDDTRAYVVNAGRIAIVDVSDPRNPTVVGEHRPVGYLQRIAVEGPYLYLTAEYAGLQIFRTGRVGAPAKGD
jgi:hypothetical protein